MSYKKASLEESHPASFAVLTATYAVLERPPKSLAEGTSYLRIVFAFADYCLTCSVALSCFRGSASGPVLLVFRRVSFAFRTVYTPHIPTRTCIDVRVSTFGHIRAYTMHDVLLVLIHEIVIDFDECPRSESNWPTAIEWEFDKVLIAWRTGNAFLRSSSISKYLTIWSEHYKQLRDSTKLVSSHEAD